MHLSLLFGAHLFNAAARRVQTLSLCQAFHRLSQEKHTLELRDTNHESSSDVLCVLEESHTTGRYQLRQVPRAFPLKYLHLRKIDIYFTDGAGNNLMLASASGGGNSGGGSSGSGDLLTAAEVGARSDLVSYFDFSDASTLTLANGGSQITGFEAVNDSGQAYTSTSGNNVQYANFGTNSGKCINLTGDWVRFTDSTGHTEDTDGNVSVLFRSQSTSDTYCIFQQGYFSAYAKDGHLTFNNTTNVSPIKIDTNTDYLLSLNRNYTDNEMTFRLENLADNSVQICKEFGIPDNNNTTGSGLQNEFGGHASHSAAGTQVSNKVETENLTAADVRKIELYLRDYHTEQTTTRTTWRYVEMEDNMDSPSDQKKYFHVCRAFDTGGSANNYGANETLNREYYSLDANPVSCVFETFVTETNYDFLSIFPINADGTLGSALLSNHSGSNLPNGGAAITGGAGTIGLKLQWTSDQSNHQTGWEAILWDSTHTLAGSGSNRYIDVAIPQGEQLDPTSSSGGGGSGGGGSVSGSFSITLDIEQQNKSR